MAKLNYRSEIQRIAISRGVEYLLHFTPALNLRSIVAYGLLSRAHLLAGGLSAYTSIKQRLDDEDRAVSVSVSAINQHMFQAKRVASGRNDWIVLILCPSIIWQLECRFYSRNAAKREMLNHRGFLGGPWAFNEMFADTCYGWNFRGESYRTQTGIPNALPTHSDAEIQVLDPISPQYILGAWISDHALEGAVKKNLNEIDGPERAVFVHDFLPRFTNGFDYWG